MADRPEKSKLGHARHAEALRRWPTPVSRTQKGLRMAREAFAASITIASCRSWHIEHLGCTVRKLTSFKRNGQVLKEYALPCLDWDDVLYMTELEKLPLDPGPSDNETPGPLKWVFADEAQDTSRIRQLMIKRLAGRTARVFVVGDDMQALYGFAGVDPDALSNLFKLFEMAVFDLPVCRRDWLLLQLRVGGKCSALSVDAIPLARQPGLLVPIRPLENMPSRCRRRDHGASDLCRNETFVRRARWFRCRLPLTHPLSSLGQGAWIERDPRTRHPRRRAHHCICTLACFVVGVSAQCAFVRRRVGDLADQDRLVFAIVYIMYGHND
jgi:hypothetical protein